MELSLVLKCSAPPQARCLHGAEWMLAVSFRCAVLLSLPWINVLFCIFVLFIFFIFFTSSELSSLQWSWNVLWGWMWKSNDWVSVQEVALKRAYKIWWAGLNKHKNISLGKSVSKEMWIGEGVNVSEYVRGRRCVCVLEQRVPIPRSGILSGP